MSNWGSTCGWGATTAKRGRVVVFKYRDKKYLHFLHILFLHTRHLQHGRMRITRLVAFRSSGATNRFRLFASIILDHELKELAPQTVLRRNKNGTFCGQGLGTFCDHSCVVVRRSPYSMWTGSILFVAPFTSCPRPVEIVEIVAKPA